LYRTCHGRSALFSTFSRCGAAGYVANGRVASEKSRKLFVDESSLYNALDFRRVRRQFLRMAQALNEKQADLLRFLTRQTDPVPTDDLDGRIIRALKLRECIVERNGHVSVTEEGRAALEDKPQRRRRGRRPNVEKTAGHARAQAIRRAIAALERALPSEAEVAVGNIFAYADDVVDGFRKYARKLETRGKE
jgi:hypothetical protein